ncbi:MAG: phosphoribosylformylglycinamidine synthase [Candidatus Micrarchaeota archaeon]|nr:phosphoribosylformylglycinamidine synthase [Candidatus Micrarchaeota archaeon]MDE1847685.1 phosphoribosylformylglycinamidine synthase [Candidatus Micrarchaeota archaeon]MDE1864506.1 phosphoribosylformylglycinamidine synthase [Candidatus Micrarchaeota archaeon]
MPERVVVGLKNSESDPVGKTLEAKLRKFLGSDKVTVKTRKVYTLDMNLDERESERLKNDLFVDRVSERILSGEEGKFDYLIEVGYKPGVTDPAGTDATIAVREILKKPLRQEERVYTSTQYLISGISKEEAGKVANELLANERIESIMIASRDEVKSGRIEFVVPVIRGGENDTVRAYDLNVSDRELVEISKNGVLALSLDEMKTIREHFHKPEVMAERKTVGMEEQFWDKPTDVELETLAQTWSEHCKHKIFNAQISYVNETGRVEEIESLFKTFIKGPSEKISEKYDWVVSSFRDNAAIIKFNERINVADKIETHNSPSALDPFGGAITGILGVNRDVMGAGIGAEPMFNVFGYCLGSPFYDKELQSGVLHPRRTRDGVHEGVSSGGNQSGIPLMEGWEIFDSRYAFRPLVYCGTIGIIPPMINGKPSEFKMAQDNDRIFMVGGAVGKDGIHGATFSSAELDKNSPAQAVQIGDSITQKKMFDFLLEARDRGLYKCITDNGAGGLSSSVGEMAKDSNGCRIDLKKAPLKYRGLAPWEIQVSESQERMTIAVEPGKAGELWELAQRRGVWATDLGTFESTGKFHATYGDRIVAYLDMGFMHDGLPKLELRASWQRKINEEPTFKKPERMDEILDDMLSRLNVCSKEDKLRQYDHEVKGLSVVKPLVGRHLDVPSDATISFLEYGSKEGIIVAHGVNPYYSDIDTYDMVASVIDEAVRRIIAVGGKLPGKNSVFYALDNFCWNFSILDSADGEYKMAQLVRANRALGEYCSEFGIPCVSGKDSMKNVWKSDSGEIISIPPTLLFSTRAKMDDVSKAVTMDVKRPGDLVYMVGQTKQELGGSEYFAYMGEKLEGSGYIGNMAPEVDAHSAKQIYNAMSEATEKELAASIHTPTIGGIGVALAQCAFAGGYGMSVDLRRVPYSGEPREDFILFSQSNSRFVVTIPPEKKEEFEKIMERNSCAQIGVVTEDSAMRIKGLDGEEIVGLDVSWLKRVWKSTLGEL